MKSENPLLELSVEKQRALVDLVEGRFNKRDVLKAGGAAGILALASGSAAGAASTSDSDGDVGEPGDRVDLFADGVDSNSVSTDEVLNSAIGDSINYIDPVWLAQSDAWWYHWMYDTLDGYEQTTSGSASLSLTSFQLQMNTGSTSGSVVQIERQPTTRLATPSWDKNRVSRWGVNIEDSTSDRTDYYYDGDPPTGEQGIGFKVSGGDLLGVVHDGGSETTTTLISGLATGPRVLMFVFDAGSNVEYFVDGVSQGTVSNGLPTGNSRAERPGGARIENSTSADRSTRFGEYRMVQAP
jgi:hypothetical protein